MADIGEPEEPNIIEFEPVPEPAKVPTPEPKPAPQPA